jgi:putative GTP pyrophosphokinase
LTEFKKFEGLKCEIQLRSILQHGWAEIEHDLGYKGENSIPDPHRRSFSRIAALLETADREFDRLKIDLKEYEKEIKTLIKKNPQEIELNQASLLSLSQTNRTFQDCIKIMTELGIELVPTTDVKLIIEKFEFFKVKTIKQLEDSLKDNKEDFINFFRDYIKDRSTNTLTDILPLFYFLHFLSALKEDPNHILDYFNYGEYKISSYNEGHLNILETYKRTKYTR